jgi:hypothetical protein
MSGPDKYKRFARMIPTQEQELANKLAVGERKLEQMEKDVTTAREKLKPAGRKKRKSGTALKKARAKKAEAIQKKNEETLGTRDEQLARLPSNKNNG